MLNAILYMAENGCKWRRLPALFGQWLAIYCRMIHWAKNGVLARVLEQLKDQMNVSPEKLMLDSPSVKVHPDGTGARKETAAVPRKISWRLEYQDSYGCCQGSPGNKVRLVAGKCARRKKVMAPVGKADGRHSAVADGPSV